MDGIIGKNVNPMNDIHEFCKKLPKVELHAHLAASLSEETVYKLVQMKKSRGEKVPEDVEKYFVRGTIELERCFDQFKIIHALVTSEDDLRLGTYETLREMAANGVRYVELRSTPRAMPSSGMTKRSYVDAILDGIRSCQNEKIKIMVKLLLSIDRRGTVEFAEDTVLLAKEYMLNSDGIVIGVDFSGNPAVNDAKDFIPAMKDATAAGLKLSAHIAEVLNNEETLAVLEEVNVGRIGHGAFLHPEAGGTQQIADLVEKRRIPIECCLKSNIICYSLPHLQDHQFAYWYNEKQHPCIPCTDGGGIFNTNLAEEYELLVDHYGFSKQQLYELSYGSIDYTFADEVVKNILRQLWTEAKATLDFS